MNTEIKEKLLETLHNQNKHILANVIEKNADVSIGSYSEKLWDYKATRPIEQALIDAFKKEFTRLDIKKETQEEIIDSISRTRSIQTAPHIGLHESSRMLMIHYLTTLGINKDEWYVVGTFSGIPFSNDSYPASISFSKNHTFSDIFENEDLYYTDAIKKQKDRERDLPNESYMRLSVAEPKDKNSIVYRSDTPKTYVDIYPHLHKKLRDLLVEPKLETSFTKTMLESNRNLISNIIPHKKIIFIDINEVISNYLQIVLQDKEHFIYKIFFDEKMHRDMIDTFSVREHFFYYTEIETKKQHHAYIDNFLLKSKNLETEIENESLIKLLAETQLCPGIFIGFTALSFLNDFQCFGSFKQIEYLTRYKRIWQESKLLPVDISHVPTDSLTTGELSDENLRFITPIDIVLGSEWHVDNNHTFGDIIEPMIPLLQAFKN